MGTRSIVGYAQRTNARRQNELQSLAYHAWKSFPDRHRPDCFSGGAKFVQIAGGSGDRCG